MSTEPELRTDLVVRREGRPVDEAPTLVLLHGLTGSGSDWSGAVRRWGHEYAILTIDQRGHGAAPRFSQEQLDAHPGEVMVEDLICVLDQLGAPPVVYGHSLGGAVALAAAARRPDLVRALVLEDPARLGPGDDQREPSRGEELVAGARPSRDAEDDDSLLRVRRDQHPTWSDDELRASGLAEQKVDLDYLANGDYKPTNPWPELFKGLLVPALVISGDDMAEVCIDAEIEQGIADLGNPNVTLVRVSGAAHSIRREQPEKLYELVSGFLAEH